MSVILSPRGNEASNMMKRFVRYEEAAQYFGIDETLIVAYAKVAGAVYQLSKIRLIKIEPLEDYMKHLTRVGRSSKLIQRKFVRVGEGTLIYNIGRNRFIEMARAAGAVYKIGDSKGSKVLIRLDTVCTLDMDVTQLQHQAMISATSILQHRQWYGRLWRTFLELVPMIRQLISYVHQHLIRQILTLTIQRLRTISVHLIMLQDQVLQAQPRVEQPLMN